MTAYLQQLYHLLEQKDFEPVFGISGLFLRIENPVLYLLAIQPLEESSAEHQTAVCALAERLQNELADYCCTQLVCLYLTIDDAPAVPKALQRTERMTSLHHIAWHFVPESCSLQVAEDSPKKLLGIEKLLQMAAKGEQIPEDTLYTVPAARLPFATLSIFVVCVSILAYGLLFGKQAQILDAWSVSRQGVLQQGEYMRLFSCMFVHSGLTHLLANSVYLLYFGTERNICWDGSVFCCCISLPGFVAVYAVCFSGMLRL